MGGGKGRKDQTTLSQVPISTNIVDNRIKTLQLKITATPSGGSLLGILQPSWNKAVESEMRLYWLKEMLEKDLVVREIQSFGEGIKDKLRTESSREEELGRDSLIELMEVKYQDEKRYHRECIKVKEQLKEWTRKKIGRRRYKHLMEKIKEIENKKRKELGIKYKEKTKHLKKKREKKN